MATGEITDLLAKLQLPDESTNIGDHFEKIINDVHKEEDSTSLCEELIKGNVLSIITKTLKEGKPDTQTKAAELVAELAKIESCRLSCVKHGIVTSLVQKMSSEETSTALQACRALGNICYEYDGGRSCVLRSGGASQLLALLKRAASLPQTPENHQLRLVSTGFLLNLLNSYDSNEQEHSMDSMWVDVLCTYLEDFATDEDIPTHILLSLSCMADSESSRTLVISRNITKYLVKVLDANNSMEVIETCLELITNLAETESVKTEVAKGGLCEAIVGVIDKHSSLDRQSAIDLHSEVVAPVIKTATDLLVLILVGDESMNVIYKNGEGKVYLELVKWLMSPIEDLQIAGALAMGNFARNDTHCSQMVESGIAVKLLEVLSAHNTSDGDIRLQHALLSALRNLSIAKQNKAIIVKQGVLNTLLPMVSSIETYPVVFKLLATLRMIIDGQTEAAVKIGENDTVINRIVGWTGSHVEHPGVQGEASRILAWVVKNCGSHKGVMGVLVAEGAVLPLGNMIQSEHVVMVNEAALALSLLLCSGGANSVPPLLFAAPFPFTLVGALRNQSLPPEVISNMLSILVALSQHADFSKAFEKSELKPALEAFSDHAVEQVKSLSQEVLRKVG